MRPNNFTFCCDRFLRVFLAQFRIKNRKPEVEKENQVSNKQQQQKAMNKSESQWIIKIKQFEYSFRRSLVHIYFVAFFVNIVFA